MGTRSMRVLILGGWSPGPLDIIRGQFRGCDFEEPNIPMPPSGLLWCCNPFCILLLGLFGLVPWLFTLTSGLSTASQVAAALGILLGAAIGARLLVAGLVRFSILHGVWTATSAMERSRPDVVVGFSWGGAV